VSAPDRARSRADAGELINREGDLTVQVDDDGAGAAARRPLGALGGGNGLVGMGERVAALGGRLEAGPRPGGGFRVVATIPLDHAA
jgi:signal transduction histidine kinase